MNNEIEAQFLDIDKDKVQIKLKEIGAKLEKPETLMKLFSELKKSMLMLTIIIMQFYF